MSTTWRFFLDFMTDSPGFSDPRTKLFLMKSPLTLISVYFFYFTAINFGPKLMKNRKPWSLRSTLVGYNILQIIFNVVIFVEMATIGSEMKVNILCTPWAKADTVHNRRQIQIHYHYILLKFFDLIETMFYIMRKKNSQISFLHVSHHVGILLCSWVSGKYFPGGHPIFVGLLNTFVHSIMYCYYLYTSLNYPTNVWWKKYITLLQMVHHCLIFVTMFPVVVNKNCSYPKFLTAVFLLLTSILIYLFAKFYKNSYLTKSKRV